MWRVRQIKQEVREAEKKNEKADLFLQCPSFLPRVSRSYSAQTGKRSITTKGQTANGIPKFNKPGNTYNSEGRNVSCQEKMMLCPVLKAPCGPASTE